MIDSRLAAGWTSPINSNNKERRKKKKKIIIETFYIKTGFFLKKFNLRFQCNCNSTFSFLIWNENWKQLLYVFFRSQCSQPSAFEKDEGFYCITFFLSLPPNKKKQHQNGIRGIKNALDLICWCICRTSEGLTQLDWHRSSAEETPGARAHRRPVLSRLRLAA